MTDTAIQKAHPGALQSVSPTGLLQMAIERGGSIDVIERLAKLQMEMMDRDARLAYIQAFETFKRTAPTILKDSDIVIKGQLMGKFAKLDQICDKLIPALLAVNITHRWKTTDGDGGRIVCTCYLRHILGHEEQGATFGAPPEQSGFKNPVQAVGSTASYLERYTLVASCGLAIKDQDKIDSGGGKQAGALDEQVVDEYLQAINGASSIDDLKAIYFDAYKKADGIGDHDAKNKIIAVKNARQDALNKRGKA